MRPAAYFLCAVLLGVALAACGLVQTEGGALLAPDEIVDSESSSP